jgi:hypothetical protein
MGNQTGADAPSLAIRLWAFLREVLVICGLIGLAIGILCLAVPTWRHHSFNLLLRTLDSFLSTVSERWMGFHSYWAVPLLGVIVTFIIVRRQHGKNRMTRWEEAKLSARVLLIVLALFFIPIFCWCLVRAVYDDHEALVKNNTELKSL